MILILLTLMIFLPNCEQHDSPTRFISRQAFLCQNCPKKTGELLDVNQILICLEQHQSSQFKNFKSQAQSQIKEFFELQRKAFIKKLQQQERLNILKIWWISLYEKTPETLKSQYFRLAQGQQLQQPSFDMLKHLANPFFVTEEYRTLIQHFQHQYEVYVAQSDMKLNELCKQLRDKYSKRGSQERQKLMANAVSAMNDHNWGRAEIFLNQTVSFDTTDLQALNRRAKCLDMQDRYVQAHKDYETIMRKDQNFKFIRYNMANLYFKYQLNNKVQQISQLIDRQLQLTPDHTKTLILKAFLFCKNQRYEDAEKVLKHCIKLCPVQRQAWILLSKVYKKLGRHKELKDCEKNLRFYSKN